MRVQFKRGKQKEFIKRSIAILNLNRADVAKKLKINKHTLNTWVKERCLLPLLIYKRICKLTKLNYSNYILDIKKDNWGSLKGAKIHELKIKQPKYSIKLAEFVGILLGDGNIFVKKYSSKHVVYQVRICGDKNNEKDYMLYFVRSLIIELFKLVPKVKFHKNSAIYICINSKPLVEFLKKIGLKSGNKITNCITIPFWIKCKKSYLQACIRGLIDTDGSVFRLSNKNPNYIRISFKNRNKKLLKDVKVALTKLGFSPSKIIYFNIFITRQSDVKKYVKEIGFKNPKHISKLREIAPWCSGPSSIKTPIKA